MIGSVKTFVLLVICCLYVSSEYAAEPPGEQLPAPLPTPEIPRQKLIVGLMADPPFVIQGPNGTWAGISVELWEQIAKELGLNYEFRETNIGGRFDGLVQGWLDVTVGPLSITPKREQICDFTHAYYVSDLGVATLRNTENQPFGLDPAFWGFLWTVSKVGLAMLGLLAIVGIFIWICERKANPTQFSGQGHPVRGLGASLWWAAVTTAGVGYGDLVPKTFLGRSIATIWMFISLVLVSLFTATMASTLTAERLTSRVTVHSVDDLRSLKVGAVENSSGAILLEQNHISFTKFPFSELLDSLVKRKVQAVVYDEPILRYAAGDRSQFVVMPLHLDTELYGFALREGSQLREPINRVLLQIIHEPAWATLVAKYLPSNS